ncbi:circadian clock KaiB family protein [Desertivirga xinjiangensis]|uniref:circadian clock KaiB family protein n=1 Tax=Desertivirga xinjiangensis TaxID=539206 RepID=UPI00210A11F1
MQSLDLENKDIYKLRLYVAGASPNSVKAISNIKNICETHLKDRYELEIIDIHQQPSIAQKEQIIALPLLIKKSPLPVRQFVGDMSDTAQVLRGFGI